MIQINYQDKRPIYEQIVEKFRTLVVRGVLKPDDKIPSVRSLAIDLSINPNTIQKAYQELERQGVIYTVKGRGNFVSAKDKWMADESAETLGALHDSVRKLMALGMSTDAIIREIRKASDQEKSEIRKASDQENTEIKKGSEDA